MLLLLKQHYMTATRVISSTRDIGDNISCCSTLDKIMTISIAASFAARFCPGLWVIGQLPKAHLIDALRAFGAVLQGRQSTQT